MLFNCFNNIDYLAVDPVNTNRATYKQTLPKFRQCKSKLSSYWLNVQPRHTYIQVKYENTTYNIYV